MTTPNSKTLARPTAASREVAVERNLTEIEQLDTLLTQRLGGDPNGYRDLLTDTTVSGVWAQRQTALTKLERQVLPHDPDNAADVEAAKFVAAQLQRLNFDAVLKAMHWGVFYGMAVGEVMWGIEDGKVVLDNVLVRDRGKFKYDLQKQLIYTGNGADEVMPPRKFWTFSAGGDTTDNPYGLGLAHFLYWPVLFKKSNVKFWLVGNEKAATSVPHGQYDPRSPTADADKQQLLAALTAIKNAAATVTPLGATIELLKGEAGTTDDAKLCEYMDEAIALVVLGQVMTSQAVGGQYKAEIQDEVKDDIFKADADLLCASFNETIAVWLTEWNFPGAHPPKLWLRTEEAKDLQKLPRSATARPRHNWSRTLAARGRQCPPPAPCRRRQTAKPTILPKVRRQTRRTTWAAASRATLPHTAKHGSRKSAPNWRHLRPCCNSANALTNWRAHCRWTHTPTSSPAPPPPPTSPDAMTPKRRPHESRAHATALRRAD